MANECLRRTPTSTGNQRVWTWSGWLKLNNLASGGTSGSANLFRCTTGSSNDTAFRIEADDKLMWYVNGASDANLKSDRLMRDVGNWTHIMGVVNTTTSVSNDRVKIYVNGSLVNKFSTETYPSINYITSWNGLVSHTIGATSTNTEPFEGEMFDVFFIDGQALTPDVFGFYKQGKGYISAGSTQATDFRPGQWVPKTPRVIKTEINRRGGFGVNGFYLPMNDSRNFGADFHGDPNSIITLNEKLPQPRVGVASTASVGLGYTDALRADPYAANLVLALPFVSGGLSSGFGDYAPSIKGSGSAKTITNNGVSIASTASYYGSASNFGVAGAPNYLQVSASSDFAYGSNNFTIETWWFPTSTTRQAIYHGSWGADYSIGIDYNGASNNQKLGMWASSNGSSWNLINADAGGNGITAGTPGQNQWNHIAYVRNGSTFSMYLNGVCVGTVTGITAAVDVTASDTQVIGEWWNTSAMNSIGGYLQDFRIYKGVAKYTGGFDVPRPYTPVGIATWRQVPDTTANNFATWNPLDRARNTGTQTDGNLSTGTNTGNYAIRSTVGVSTGKWYWEFCPTAVSITNHHGIVAVGRSMGTFYLGETIDSWGMYDNNGNKRNNASFDAYGTGFSQYDVGMVALDKTNGKIWWGKNGTWFASGNPASGTNEAFSNINIVCSGIGTDSFVSPSQLQYNSCSYNFGQNPTFSGNTTVGTYADTNGKGLFKYQPPSGFLALCEDNLPTPAISDPGKYFKTVLWTGDGNSGRSIVGVGFTPDLVWIKSRNNAAYGHKLFDSIRGPKLQLESNATDGDISVEGVYSFNSDGFSIGSYSAVNQSTYPFVAWCWRAGAGTTSTNTNGSITSVVSVNQDAGFSIVSYTGNGTSGATVGHGLGKAPKFILIKRRSGASNWAVAGSILGANSTLYLNLTNATDTYGDTNLIRNIQTSTTFELGTDTNRNQSGGTHIAYCWAEIEGFSKFGSYVGNGNADGPFVYCGFKPALVIVKRTAGAADWVIHDSSRTSTNPSDTILRPNTSDIDLTASSLNIDFLSNGFKIRNTNASYNNAETYIFAAFAQSPFQTANSK